MRDPSQSTTRIIKSTQTSFICDDTTLVLRGPQKKMQDGSESKLGRKKANSRGITFVSERNNPFSQKRPYCSASFCCYYWRK